MDQFLSLDEAAEILGVDYKTVYRLVRTGELAAGKIGRVYRIRHQDLNAYFESTMKRTPTPMRGLRCCVTGNRIVSELDIGGYCSRTGEPICARAWASGNRGASEPADTTHIKGESK